MRCLPFETLSELNTNREALIKPDYAQCAVTSENVFISQMKSVLKVMSMKTKMLEYSATKQKLHNSLTQVLVQMFERKRVVQSVR